MAASASSPKAARKKKKPKTTVDVVLFFRFRARLKKRVPNKKKPIDPQSKGPWNGPSRPLIGRVLHGTFRFALRTNREVELWVAFCFSLARQRLWNGSRSSSLYVGYCRGNLECDSEGMYR